MVEFVGADVVVCAVDEEGFPDGGEVLGEAVREREELAVWGIFRSTVVGVEELLEVVES
jgi:hypothetical protein